MNDQILDQGLNQSESKNFLDKSKNLLIFLIIILIFILLVNVYVLSRVNKPKNINQGNNFSNGLQTYEDKKYEFSFKYPLNWYLYKKDKNIYLQKENNIQCADDNRADFFIDIEDIISGKTIDNAVDDYLSKFTSDSTKYKREKITVQNGEGIKITENCDPSSMCGDPFWIILHKNFILIFNQSFGGSKYSEILDKIISTVEFVPTPTNIPNLTDNWEIYKNEKYNYSIKYPSSWSIKEDKNYFNRDTLFIEAPKEDPNDYQGEVFVSILKYPDEIKNSPIESEMKKAKDKVQIAGVVGLELMHNSDPEYSTIDGRSIFLQKNGFIYAISSDTELSYPDASVKKQIMDQIINSFQFL
jgi:hypothetical protein